MFGSKPLDQITETDLQALIDAQAPEKRTLDYKQTLPGNSDGDKKEFLADVSSFANAAGGYLIFGIAEGTDGTITMPGLQDINSDQEILRIEQMVLQGVEPRIPGFHAVAVTLANGNRTIILHIPRSWAMPHRVSFKESDKFYTRRSAGKFRLDYGELRSAFLQSGAVIDKINGFRIERLSQIVAGESLLGNQAGTQIVLHLVPISAYNDSTQFDLTTFQNVSALLLYYLVPMAASGGFNSAYNYDGFATYTPHSYTQVFRNGAIEAAYHIDRTSISLRGEYIEQMLIELTQDRLLLLLREMGVQMPIVAILSINGVRGSVVVPEQNQYLGLSEHLAIKRDTLLLPNVMLERYEIDVATTMKPAFDVMWNASGWPQSPSYGTGGKFKER